MITSLLWKHFVERMATIEDRLLLESYKILLPQKIVFRTGELSI